MTYLAVIHKEEDTCYGASFPEIPGCTAASDTLDEVIDQAQEALSLYLEEAGSLPEPKGLKYVLENSLPQGRLLVAAFQVPIKLKSDRLTF